MAATAANRDEPWVEQYRLPETVLPLHYDLYINPDLQTKLFSGKVSIEINSTTPRDYFLLHIKGLNITNTTLTKQSDSGEWESVTLLDTFEYTPNEFFVIRTKNQQESGLFSLSCVFDGSLIANGLVGFYYSDYKDENNVTKVLATTKFEPTFARQSFPCFDEPSFKSTYNVTVVRPSAEGYIVLSNMPVQLEEENKPAVGFTEVTLEKSVPMVTYLVCFIVCEFTFLEKILPTGLPFRVYAPSDRVNKTQYALDTGADILQYYEQVFDYPFPLPKSDMAAIPDYVSGATEHWGIITYRETSILYSPDTSSETNKQRVASVVAHELAHQWFGNLVTLKWWDDLWLNEGFASYIEFKGVDHVHPDWDMETQFVTTNLQPVFDLDSKLSSHPIVQTVSTPDEITAMFDSISYDKDSQFVSQRLQRVFLVDGMVSSHPIVKQVSTPDQITGMFDVISYLKGSSVLRMLEGFVGTAVFQSGINNFIKKYAYQNAVTAQLWQELTLAWNVAGVDGDVGKIMGTWTEQMGYPVLNVTTENILTGTRVTLTQQRFLQDPTAVSDPSSSPYGFKWDIPISYLTSENTNSSKMIWLYKEQPSVSIDLPSSVTWFKVNALQTGYFRVNYEPAVWDSMGQLCSQQTISSGDRSSLYDDSFALADASLIAYSVPLNLSESLGTEDHLVPWTTATNRFPRIIYLLKESPYYEQFKSFVSELVNDIYTSVGWQDEGDHIKQLLRVQIVYLACFSGQTECLSESAALLQAYADDVNAPMPLSTFRQVLRQGMVQGGTSEVWETLWQRCAVTQDATLKDNLLYGLANVQDLPTLERYITMSQNSSIVRTQDFLHVLNYISSNPFGTDLVWDWTRANWEWLVDRYTINDRYLGQLIPDITQYFATQEKLTEMEEFFALYPEAGAGEQYREQALETVETNIRWLGSNSDQIGSWLGSRE